MRLIGAAELGVRQKYMPPATVYFESHAPRQELWLDAMRVRTTDGTREIYPEAGITATATPDRPLITRFLTMEVQKTNFALLYLDS